MQSQSGLDFLFKDAAKVPYYYVSAIYYYVYLYTKLYSDFTSLCNSERALNFESVIIPPLETGDLPRWIALLSYPFTYIIKP